MSRAPGKTKIRFTGVVVMADSVISDSQRREAADRVMWRSLVATVMLLTPGMVKV